MTEAALNPSASKGPDIPARVQDAVDAARDLKAVDLKVLHLEPVSDFTDYFILATGTSDRQVRAMCDAVMERLEREGVDPLHVEGLAAGKWVLIDYGDFVFHVFDEERRSFYGIERLWSDAPDVTPDFVS